MSKQPKITKRQTYMRRETLNSRIQLEVMDKWSELPVELRSVRAAEAVEGEEVGLGEDDEITIEKRPASDLHTWNAARVAASARILLPMPPNSAIFVECCAPHRVSARRALASSYLAPSSAQTVEVKEPYRDHEVTTETIPENGKWIRRASFCGGTTKSEVGGASERTTYQAATTVKRKLDTSLEGHSDVAEDQASCIGREGGLRTKMSKGFGVLVNVGGVVRWRRDDRNDSRERDRVRSSPSERRERTDGVLATVERHKWWYLWMRA
ncbi:hypothetical protein DFP72DRAFT_859014 [Ephemerocybe angulata]|uniref:Uncharacterized protein n=1 Tax=Ephemerocybe angulata TaxID=980116 RepID=A0A8H6LWI8_9AGAR|nr:hypothetical protein DFP72DRAFT_859014 [Tulosesus angulatus]